MKATTFDNRIDDVIPIRSPISVMEELPLRDEHAIQIVEARKRISNIIHRVDDRLLVVIGPCSIHDPDAAIEYANRLMVLREKYNNALEIVMRVYFEKPRTTVGWKGLINDPDINGSFDIDKGLFTARKLLLKLAELGLPAGCEFLDAATGQYYADLVSWGAIGARTTESQVHREIASGLSCPVGFKNGTSGNIDIAIDAVTAAINPHAFLSPNTSGTICLYKTSGNADAHIILRGGSEPNFDQFSVADACKKQIGGGIDRRILIDCSHANSGRDYSKQVVVVNNIAKRLSAESDFIAGVMIESHLIEGKQAVSDNLTYGQSITDACLGWDQTAQVLELLNDSIVNRNCPN